MYFRTCTRGEAHFKTTRCISRCEESFRPRCIITIGKYVFCTIYGNCFCICCEATHAKFQFCRFFQGALCQYTWATTLRAYEQANRIEWCVTSNGYCCFFFCEPTKCTFRSIRCDLHWIVVYVRYMGLVSHCTTSTHFLHTLHHFNNVHRRNNFQHFRWSNRFTNLNDFFTRY